MIQEYPTHPDWNELEEGCIQFANELTDSFIQIDAVVGLTRGGLVNAVIFSHQLGDAPVIPVDYSSKMGAGDNISAHSNDVPQIRGHNLLIVDDIADSGHTMAELDHLLRSRGHTVLTYVSYWKEGSALTPTGYQYKIPANAPWIVMPWE
jgi:hypothetical protein